MHFFTLASGTRPCPRAAQRRRCRIHFFQPCGHAATAAAKVHCQTDIHRPPSTFTGHWRRWGGRPRLFSLAKVVHNVGNSQVPCIPYKHARHAPHGLKGHCHWHWHCHPHCRQLKECRDLLLDLDSWSPQLDYPPPHLGDHRGGHLENHLGDHLC